MLHEVGTSIHFKGFHRHGAYILGNSALPGFNTDEQQLVATLVLHHRKRLAIELPSLTLFDDGEQLKLILLLRIAALLHLHRSEDMPIFEVSAVEGELALHFDQHWLDAHPLLEERLMKETKEWVKVGFKLTKSLPPAVGALL